MASDLDPNPRTMRGALLWILTCAYGPLIAAWIAAPYAPFADANLFELLSAPLWPCGCLFPFPDHPISVFIGSVCSIGLFVGIAHVARRNVWLLRCVCLGLVLYSTVSCYLLLGFYAG